jgi:NTE family protein
VSEQPRLGARPGTNDDPPLDASGKARQGRMRAAPTIALALGGGGARGLAHILMLEVFDELGIRPKVIAGTSIGALFGAAYASGLSARLIRAHVEEALSQRFDIARQLLSARAEPVLKILNFLPVRSALLKPEALLEFMLPASVARDFAQLQIPLKVVATDYYGQEQTILTEGGLRTAVAASIALPALFTPVTVNGRMLMDGGLTNPLPFDILHGEGNITVAIDVSGAPVMPGKRPHPSAFAMLMASSQIMQRTIVRQKLKVQQPDIYIDVEVDAYYVLDFHRFKQIMADAAPAKEQLRRQLERVLTTETLETLPAAMVPALVAQPPSLGLRRKRRLPSLKRLSPLRRKE